MNVLLGFVVINVLCNVLIKDGISCGKFDSNIDGGDDLVDCVCVILDVVKYNVFELIYV